MCPRRGATECSRGSTSLRIFSTPLESSPRSAARFFRRKVNRARIEVVLLSDSVWRGQFGADPHIVGQTIHLDQKPFSVIGVMGSDATLPQTAEVWMPLALQAKDWADRGTHELFVVARLREGSTIDQAQAEMRTISRRLSDAYPNTNRDWSARVMSLAVFAVGDYSRQYMFLSFGANAFVLLIACANVANLQLARVTLRQKEVALRMALGANRWRIVRQFLVESILLALGGAIVGLLVASWEIHFILAYMPADVARFIGGWDQIRLDPAALGFAACAGTRRRNSRGDCSSAAKLEGRPE